MIAIGVAPIFIIVAILYNILDFIQFHFDFDSVILEFQKFNQ